jgi:hypothetical protein
LLHSADDACYFDAISDRDGSLRQNNQAADEVAGDILQPETNTDPNCAREYSQRGQMNSCILQDNENANDQDDIANDLGNRVLERTIESTLSKEPVKKKTLRPRRNPEDGNQERDQQKNLNKT